MDDLIINVKFINKKEIVADAKIIGKTFENKAKILNIQIPIQFKDWNLFLEFEKYNGDKFTTPKLEILESNEGYYSQYTIVNSLLDVEGYLKMEIIFKKEDITFKSYALDFRILSSINASEEIPEKYPDFVSYTQKVLNSIEFKGNGDKYLADNGVYKNIDDIGLDFQPVGLTNVEIDNLFKGVMNNE